MVINMNKNSDYYYKTNDFIYLDNKEKLTQGMISDYGYNLDSTNRRTLNEREFIIKSQVFINKDFLNNRKIK
jgi:hypothetical protein